MKKMRVWQSLILSLLIDISIDLQLIMIANRMNRAIAVEGQLPSLVEIPKSVNKEIWPITLIVKSHYSSLNRSSNLVSQKQPLDEVSYLNKQVNQLFRLGQHAQAIPLAERALAIQEKVIGKNHLDTASSQNKLALLYQLTGRYKEAEPLYKQALSIRENRLGGEHPLTVDILHRLAKLYRLMGRFAEADPIYKRAIINTQQQLKLGQQTPSPVIAPRSPNSFLQDHMISTQKTELVEVKRLTKQATELYKQGQYTEAISISKRALAILEQRVGLNHPETSSGLNNLASLYQKMSRNVEAEALFKRALVIAEQKLGVNHPNTATLLNNLSTLYKSMGRYKNAEELYRRALAIFEQKLGVNHPNTATLLNNLGELYMSLGLYEKAEPLFERALAIDNYQPEADQSNLTSSLNNLAVLYKSMGRYREAESFFQQVLNIRERKLGSDHPSTATSLNNMGELYRSMDRYEEAETLFKRALLIFNRQLGDRHPNTSITLNNLALNYFNQKQFQAAFNYFQQGIAAYEAVLQRNLVGGSDTDKRNLLAIVRTKSKAIVSLHLNYLPQMSKMAELSLTTILQSKGRVLDVFTDLRGRLKNDPTAISLLDALRGANHKLSILTYNRPQGFTHKQYHAQLLRLQSQINEMEDRLSRRSSEFIEITATPSLLEIQDVLPKNAALIEFIRYQAFSPKSEPQERIGPARYAVYILQPNSSVKGIDLGPAEKIDQAIQTLSTSLSSPDTPVFQLKEESQVLDSLIMAPVRQVLGSTTTVFISTDGALSLIPFAALVDESGDYLMEKYHFQYLTSGRDLMRFTKDFDSVSSSVLLGDPTFSRLSKAVEQPVEVVQREIDIKNNIFPRLDGTEEEIKQIAQRLPNSQVYLKTRATEAQLKAIQQPHILHIATHGYFIDSKENTNPLLNSGLVLAGVKERQSGPDQDGILSALEVTGLNLRGTELVVLSACETGRGELADGEGVYGLRRALVLAGSRSQVISLWKVDDKATQEFMVDYYDRLLAGENRDAALQKTQRAFLKHPDYKHPYFWSAFISSGDWRKLPNLQSKR